MTALNPLIPIPGAVPCLGHSVVTCEPWFERLFGLALLGRILLPLLLRRYRSGGQAGREETMGWEMQRIDGKGGEV